MLRYDGKSLPLHVGPEKFRHELYRAGESDSEDEWSFTGLINHTLQIQQVEQASAGMDKALETLKTNMAAIEQDRKART